MSNNANFGKRSIPNTPSLSLARVCVCRCVVVLGGVPETTKKRSLVLSKELLLWRVIVCEKISSVEKKRGFKE